MTKESLIKSLLNAPLDYGLPKNLVKVCDVVLKQNQFREAVASANHHHSYFGGLITHTAEVMSYAENIADLISGVAFHILIPAVIFHDFAKIYEYDVTYKHGYENEISAIIKLPYADEIGHVAGSFAYWHQCTARHNMVLEGAIDEDIIAKVGHCILSHHGRKDWGAIVEPQTKEALILHQADMLSSRYGEFKDTK